jgi:hypothetical protein
MAETGLSPELLHLSNEAVDAEILKAIGEYAELDNQSDKITAKRTKIRERMEKKHGYSSLAFQEVVRKVKKMDATEREKHEEMVARGLRVAGVLKQAELWPEMAKKAEARKSKRDKKAAKEAAAAATKTAADIERGDPKRGGAGGANGRGKAKDAAPKVKKGATAADRAEAAAARKKKVDDAKNKSPGNGPGKMANPDTRPPGMRSADPVIDASLKGLHDQELADGEATLNAGLTETRKAQSKIAAEKVDAAMAPAGKPN